MATEELFIQTKKCTNPKCGLVKPVSEFYKNIYNSSGFSSRCKICRSLKKKHKYTLLTDTQRKIEAEQRKIWNKNNSEKRREYSRTYVKKTVLLITDAYIRMILHRQKFSTEFLIIHPEIVEHERMRLKFKRLIKTKKNESTS